MYTLKFGASTCGYKTPVTAKLFDTYAKHDIRFMEFSMNPGLLPYCNWTDIKKASTDTGVDIWSFHLPFDMVRYNIAYEDHFLRKMTIAELSNYIETAAYIGAKYVVVHPSGEPISDERRKEQKKYSKESLQQLADKAEMCGVTVAVEDLPRTCLGNTALELFELVSCDDRLKVCFDVNHLLKDTHDVFVSKLADRIVTLHISDYDFVDERHLLPGQGKINWSHLLDLLENAGYAGPFMYEVEMRTSDDVSESRVKLPTYEDGIKSYLKVMNREL